MKVNTKKFLCLVLALCMMLSTFSIGFTAVAAETDSEGVSVEIVSFMRGSQKDLRSSELLEARLTGYEGNPRELKYKWESTLGTYLYVYNSHNMYYIEGTDGEIEIYNSQVPTSTNMAGRSYKDSFTGTGYCWAAIYGSNTSGQRTSISDSDAYDGMIKVTVYDKDGNEIATDSHEGKVETTGFWLWQETTYSGIVDHNLQDDMDNVTIGIFVGDEKNVKDLLGESAILHISCVESSVTQGQIVSGGQLISLRQDGDYYIKGVKAGSSTTSEGDAKVSLTVSKNTCKFHEKSSGTATTTVYVFEKPTTSTTAYTLTLTGGLDDRCRYFIYGQEGKEVDGQIVFEGLKPNTEYPVEVRAEYKDDQGFTHYTYAYVYDTTKPVYTGTVQVYLDGTYDSATHTATGTEVNLEDVSGYSKLYAKEVNGTEFIELKKVEGSVGTYTNVLDEGSYLLYYAEDESTKIDDQLLTMHNADRTRYLFYNSVTYLDGDTQLSADEHVTGSAVDVWDEVPQKEGYVFTGWKDQNGNIYKSTDELTESIGEPYVLEAMWEEGVDVYVNITISHIAENGGHYLDDQDRHDVSFDLMSRAKGSNSNFADVFDAPVDIKWNGTDAFLNDYFVSSHIDDGTTDKTYYEAKAPLLSNVLGGQEYSVEVVKTHYEIVSLSTVTAENGDVTVNVELIYDPKNADLTFTVELCDESKELVKNHPEYKPAAVHVKVLSWYSKGYKEIEDNTWEHISQHHDTFVTLYLDENGTATGSYPVWMHNAKETEYYHYRIKVVSYVLADGTVISTEDVVGKENVEYLTADDRYLATIYVTDGNNPAPQYTSLTGAHFNNEQKTQQGELRSVIHINTYDVTFEPDGGKFADGTTDSKTAAKQIEVPALSEYAVTKDGGYVFDGWYLVDENGNITDKTVNSFDTLLSDITLRAKWKAPLTVEGNIFVAGYYHLNNDVNEIRIIKETSRTHAVTVNLQKILPNGYTETIETQKSPVAYNDMNMEDVDKPMGSANYRFTGLPDDGTQYRVLIQNPNYVASYQHEDESIDPSKMFDYEQYYNDEDFVAEFGQTEPLIADVNAFMEFVPTEFTLHYAINAEKIGEALRPDAAKIVITFDDGESGQNAQNWPVITQMETDTAGVYKVDDTKITDGTGSDSFNVWRTKPDGHSLYDYGVKLYKYTTDSQETVLNEAQAPFFVYYNGSARYSALEGLKPAHQTQLLTIELQPKRYNIIFDVNFTETQEDYVKNMEDYLVFVNKEPEYLEGHLWSYDTDISNVQPVRDGYKFLGWYDKNDNLVTKIDADVHQDVTVYAKWEKAIKVTFHANNEDIDYDVFRTYYEAGVQLSDEDAYFLNADGSLDSFYDIPEFEYYTHNNYVFKGWYYENGTPITWNEKYTEDTDLYAQWIEVTDVNKDINDKKQYDNSGKYPGFDLLGVQIRTSEVDSVLHYGKEGAGIRFITVLSNDVYKQINDLNAENKSGAEYGFVLTKTATAQKNAGDAENYELQYKDKNVNGVDTTAEFGYVKNSKCSGVTDHFGDSNTEYRLYTTVVTYKGLTGDKLEQAQSQPLLARSYIRYTDANGLLRTHYNNYTGNSNVYSGCSASYKQAIDLMNG